MASATFTLRPRCRTIIVLPLVLLLVAAPAGAVHWQPLASTDRHDVSLDTDAIRLNTFGRLTVWLRFMPRGERQRRAAAAEYGHKGYRMHLEYYEIDCGERSSITGLIDLLGKNGQRLARLKGGGPPDLILPGSVLDRAMLQVCPALEDTLTEEEEEAAPPESSAASGESPLPEELRQQIAQALQRTTATPDDVQGWIELGNAYYDADRPQQAIEAYGRALALSPADSNVLNDQGAMYRQLGQFEKALSNFEQALVHDPNNLESLYNMGYVQAFDLNRTDRALVTWRRYLKLDSSSETARQVKSFVDRYGSTPAGSGISSPSLP